MLFYSTAFQVNYCCAVKENKNIWEGLFILQWLTKSMQVVIKKCRQLAMGGATCTFWNPFTNLWHWLPITRDNIRGKRIFHGEDPSAFRALPVQSQQIKPLSSILYHWRLIHRAWWHDTFSFQEEQGNFCKNISLGGYGSMIFFCTVQSLYLKVQIKTVIDSVHSLSLDKYMIFFSLPSPPH